MIGSADVGDKMAVAATVSWATLQQASAKCCSEQVAMYLGNVGIMWDLDMLGLTANITVSLDVTPCR